MRRKRKEGSGWATSFAGLVAFARSIQVLEDRGGRIQVTRTSRGTIIEADCGEEGIWIRLTARSGSAHSWEPVKRIAAGAWMATGAVVPHTATPAYETMGNVPPLPHVTRGWRDGGIVNFMAKTC